MQRAILEVRFGPLGGTKAVLEPGRRLRVGRKPRADLVVPDRQMSGVHFELEWDGARCQLRDLRSAVGTLLGGERVEAGEVRNGAWIRAGSTDFSVYFEAATPPPLDFDTYLDDAEEDEVDPLAARWLRDNREPRRRGAEALTARKDQALAALGATAARARSAPAEGGLYAVLDAARSDRILTLLQESVEPYRSLYEGIDGESLAHVAPYLVELPPGSRLLERLVREGWERRWGIFIECQRSFKELRRHLRRFLMVQDADTRKKYYFRFYDPVVLRTFVPTSTVKQRAELLKGIRALLAEGERGEVWRFEAEAA